MRFTYQYRTPDNKSHTGIIDAASRDAAFAALKAQGVRPGRVEEAPGFFNKLFGKGKRWIAIGVLAVVACISLAYAFRTKQSAIESNSSALSRRQIYGDPALMERLEAENYASVFEAEGDRILANFAQPARISRVVAALDGNPILRAQKSKLLSSLSPHSPSLVPHAADPREVQELKRIVLWMRGELEAYLANGNGTTESYVRRLCERQAQEAKIYNLAKVELEKEKNLAEWERRNEMLRAIGAPTIPMPYGLQME